MSAPIAKSPPLKSEPHAGALIPRAAPTRGPRTAVLGILAPAAAALAAILTHRLLPNQQTGLPTRLYPLLLWAILAWALGMAGVAAAWPRSRAWARHIGPLLAGVIVWLGVWDLLTLKLAWLPLPFFPAPDAVLEAMQAEWRLLLVSAYDSLKLLLTGYGVGVALGLVSGVLMGWFRGVRYWGMPVMKAIGPIPATALVPLALLLFSSPFVSGVALIALAVWFPVTMLTSSGIANVPASYFDVARTLGARRGYLICRVAFPAALPTIFIGLFMGLLVAFLTLMVAETVGVKNGLGYYIVWRKGTAEYDQVYAALFLSSAFFSGIMTLLFRVRDRVLRWQQGVIRW